MAANTNTTRAVTLRWQLAEVFEKMNEIQKARILMEECTRMAKGTHLEAAAQKRLNDSKKHLSQ